VKLFVSIFVLVSFMLGCDRSYPEDRYLGTEKWINFATHDDRMSDYDLGSVRRTGDTVIYNQRSVLDPYNSYLKSAPENIRRQQAGLPLVVQIRSTVKFNCKKRTVEVSGGAYVLEDGTTVVTDSHNIRERTLRPNSSGETIFKLLCMTEV
jgi:hypothetical protein